MLILANVEYYGNGENVKIQKIYHNFHYNLDQKEIVIINFSYLSVFSIFLVKFKMDANFPHLRRNPVFFILLIFLVCCVCTLIFALDFDPRALS